jgi:hypothetical protein
MNTGEIAVHSTRLRCVLVTAQREGDADQRVQVAA